MPFCWLYQQTSNLERLKVKKKKMNEFLDLISFWPAHQQRSDRRPIMTERPAHRWWDASRLISCELRATSPAPNSTIRASHVSHFYQMMNFFISQAASIAYLSDLGGGSLLWFLPFCSLLQGFFKLSFGEFVHFFPKGAFSTTALRLNILHVHRPDSHGSGASECLYSKKIF